MRRLVASVRQDELGLRRNRFPVALAEIVEHGDGMSVAQQAVGDHASDVSRTTGDQYPHSSAAPRSVDVKADCNAWAGGLAWRAQNLDILFSFWTNDGGHRCSLKLTVPILLVTY